MNDGAPVYSLVLALIAGAIGGARGRGAGYGALAGGVFHALWSLRGLGLAADASAAPAFVLLAYGGVQGLVWGAVWGTVGGFFTRKRKTDTSKTSPSDRPHV